MQSVIIKALTFLGANTIVLGIASISSICGLLLTLLVFFRTKSLAKALKAQRLLPKFERRKKEFKGKFSGHWKTIGDDHNINSSILAGILEDISDLEKYKLILTQEQRCLSRKINRIIKKANRADSKELVNCLSKLSGSL